MTKPGPDIDGLLFVRHLGEGGYSDVYLYERRSPRMKVAVKVLKEGRLTEQEQRQFADEAETMAELADHPNIVQVFSTEVTPDGRPYLVMKFYPKPNLAARAARERFSVAETLRTGIKIAGAVETAHRAGIIHRDIKPANVLESQFDEPGLTDFGIAGRAADLDDGDDIGLSLPWSPPEVISGASNGSARSDVYSLAATLWHLLVGRSPFETPGGDNGQYALSQRVLNSPPPNTGRGDVPASLERLLAQSLSKNPAVRPRSAFEFAQALQSIEQELRFATTDILVGGGGDEPVTRKSDTGDATRMKAPTRVEAQPQRRPERVRRTGPSSFAPPTQRPPAPAATPAAAPPATPQPEPPTRSRPAVVAGQPPVRERAAAPSVANPATVRRAEAAEDDEAAPAPRRRGIRPRTVGLVAAGVVVVAVVLGVVLTAGGDDKRTGDALPTSAATDQTEAPVADPVPQVTSTYAAASRTLVFRWTVPGAKPGDRYVWARTDADITDSRPGSATSATITTADPVATCINVAYLPRGASTPENLVKACGSSS